MAEDNSKNRFKLIPLHKRPDLIDGCCQLLNSFWPISYGYRQHILERSNDNFPLSLVLLDTSKIPEKVVGHVRASRVLGDDQSLMLTSVIVDQYYRGANVGKFMMHRSEDFARERGFHHFYLTTTDSVGFYQKCGYKLGQPVQRLSSNNINIQDLYRKFQPQNQPPTAGNVGMGDGQEVWLMKDF